MIICRRQCRRIDARFRSYIFAARIASDSGPTCSLKRRTSGFSSTAVRTEDKVERDGEEEERRQMSQNSNDTAEKNPLDAKRTVAGWQFNYASAATAAVTRRDTSVKCVRRFCAAEINLSARLGKHARRSPGSLRRLYSGV